MSEISQGTADIAGVACQALAEQFGTPLYVYDTSRIRANLDLIRDSINYKPMRIHFACMSNSNVELLRAIHRFGAGVHACTAGQYAIAKCAGFEGEEIVVTGCNLTDEDIRMVSEPNVRINADSLGQLSAYVEIGKVKEIGIRINPSVHKPKGAINVAVGPDARVGITEKQLPEAADRATQHGARIVGAHTYVGTDIRDEKYMLHVLESLLSAAMSLEDLTYVDIGGGFSIPYESEQKPFDWDRYGAGVRDRFERLSERFGRRISLLLEPGRAVIGDAGTLLARVVDVKTQNGHTFVGTDTGFSNFARPYIYGKFHRVSLAAEGTRPPAKGVAICGNTVAANDFLAKGLTLPAPRVSDLIAIHDVGAYGYSMSSHFCSVPRPAEVLIEDGVPRLIRRRETVDDLVRDAQPPKESA